RRRPGALLRLSGGRRQLAGDKSGGTARQRRGGLPAPSRDGRATWLEPPREVTTMNHLVRIQILQVPDCPLVERVRETVQSVLARLQLEAEVEELVGEYPSPTLLIDGRDVTGRPLQAVSSCRLDLPTEQQVLTALGIAGRREDQPATVSGAAFRQLLQ